MVSATAAVVQAPAGSSSATVNDVNLGSPKFTFAVASGPVAVAVDPISSASKIAPPGSTPFKTTGAVTLIDIKIEGASGPYTICVDGQSPTRLWHFENSAWRDVTDRAPNDYVGGKVCGTVDSLSPFALAVGKAKQDVLQITTKKLFVNRSISLQVNGGTTKGAVTYEIRSGPCAISGSELSSASAGTCVVVATMAGNDDYLAVSSEETSVSVLDTSVFSEQDDTVYAKLPSKVASLSAMRVLTSTELKRWRLVSLTPQTCVAIRDNLVFVRVGLCRAEIVTRKSSQQIRRLSTRVQNIDRAAIGVGNPVRVMSPLYFDAGRSELTERAKRALGSSISDARSARVISIVGHTGNVTGRSGENLVLGLKRAQTVANHLRARKVTARFAVSSAGDSLPVTFKQDQKAQNRNRRVVVILIP